MTVFLFQSKRKPSSFGFSKTRNNDNFATSEWVFLRYHEYEKGKSAFFDSILDELENVGFAKRNTTSTINDNVTSNVQVNSDEYYIDIVKDIHSVLVKVIKSNSIEELASYSKQIYGYILDKHTAPNLLINGQIESSEAAKQNMLRVLESDDMNSYEDFNNAKVGLVLSINILFGLFIKDPFYLSKILKSL